MAYAVDIYYPDCNPGSVKLAELPVPGGTYEGYLVEAVEPFKKPDDWKYTYVPDYEVILGARVA